MLAQYIRGGCWWHASKGQTFPPIFHCILLLCDRWQQGGSLTEWCLTWKCVWNKGVLLDSSTWKKMVPIYIHWHLLNIYGDQRMWAQWVGEWYISAVVALPVGHLCWCRYLQACRLFFITSENTELMMVTLWENSVLYLRICSIKQCYCILCICCNFCANK